MSRKRFPKSRGSVGSEPPAYLTNRKNRDTRFTRIIYRGISLCFGDASCGTANGRWLREYAEFGFARV